MGHRMGDRICMTGPPARGLLEKRGVRFAAHLVVLLLLPLLLLLFYAGLLRGPSPYEATAVSRLRAAGASLVVDLSQGSRDTWKDVSSLAPALHLAVSALPASLQALPPEEPSNGGAPSSSSTAISSGKVDAAPEGPPGGAYEMQGAPQRYPVAFCPTKGSISSFGCFSAAASLVEAPSLAAAADGGPSPLLRPSWGPPGLWLHGGDVSLLRRALKVLSGIDPRDMQTLLFQQQQQQQLLLQQQQQQQQKVSSTSMALLHVNSTSEGDGAPSLSPSLSPSQQRLLRRLKQLQQSKQLQGLRGIWGPRGPSAWEVGAETLQRAIIGGALLQCCEAAGLLLRLGQGAPAEEGPSPSGQAPMQQHQEDEGRQQQQRENHWLRVFRERTARLNASNKHRILLGGTILRDPHRAIFLRGARAAQDAFRHRMEALFREADVLLHLAEAPKASPGGPLSSGKIEAEDPRPSPETPKPPPSPLRASSCSLVPPMQKETLSSGSQRAPGGAHEQLIAAATATGIPCFVSADGWLLLGAPGADHLVLSVAAALLGD